MLQPQPISERLLILDSLRGFALLGVLVTNTFLFNISQEDLSSYFDQFTGPLNQASAVIIKGLFRGRFFPIFAFLFGLGIGIQYKQNRARAIPYFILFKRLIILLLIGCAHYVFIWDGDILVKYALAGLLAVLLAPAKSKLILMSSMLVYAIHALYTFNLYGLQHAQPASQVATNQHILDYSSYLGLVIYRFQSLVRGHFEEANLFYMIKITAFILFGLFVGKRYDIKALAGNTKLWQKTFVLLVLLRILTASLSYALSSESVSILLSFINYAVNPAIYVSGFVLYICTRAGEWLRQPLSYVGRMSLTNYLLQTLVLSFLFYGYGFGKFQVWSPALLLALSCAIFSLQVVLSYLWLKENRQGPIELLWRRATYSRLS